MIILLFVGFGVKAQEVYHVTRVSGNITNLTTGQPIVAGVALSPDDRLLFESLESYAITIGDNMNRFLIKLPETEGNLENRVLTASVKEVASPTKMRNLMLARFDPKQAEVNDLRQYFGNDKFSIIGNAVDIHVVDDRHRQSIGRPWIMLALLGAPSGRPKRIDDFDSSRSAPTISRCRRRWKPTTRRSKRAT